MQLNVYPVNVHECLYDASLSVNECFYIQNAHINSCFKTFKISIQVLTFQCILTGSTKSSCHANSFFLQIQYTDLLFLFYFLCIIKIGNQPIRIITSNKLIFQPNQTDKTKQRQYYNNKSKYWIKYNTVPKKL